MRKSSGNQEAVLILGMHRSATSLTAKLLHEFGIYLGKEQDMLPANEHNKDGYFEREDVVYLHERILLENARKWDAIKKKHVYSYGDAYKEQINSIIDKLCVASKNKFAIKDPRLCIFEPLWQKELEQRGISEKIIVVFRHPYEVAKSLESRDHMNFFYALKLWFYYNNLILNHLLKYEEKKVLYIDHNDYFINPNKQIKELTDFLDLDCDSEMYVENIKGSLRHHLAEQPRENKLYGLVMKLYTYFLDLKNGDAILTEENVEVFNRMWDIIYSTSYESDAADMPNVCYQSKAWCIYQMKAQKVPLINKIQNYFVEKEITEIFIYGDGTVAEAFYAILENMPVTVRSIVDQNPNRSEVILQKKRIPVIKLQNAKLNGNIINTVVNHSSEISAMLRNVFSDAKLILLSDIIYECIVFD